MSNAQYYQYRYASIKDPLLANNHLIKDKAFPILEFKIRGGRIKDVKLMLAKDPLVTDWFHFDQVMLFKGSAEWLKLRKARSQGTFRNLLNSINSKLGRSYVIR
jgi:hypothetical protein